MFYDEIVGFYKFEWKKNLGFDETLQNNVRVRQFTKG